MSSRVMTSPSPKSPLFQTSSGSRLRRTAAKRTKKPSVNLRSVKMLPDVFEEDELQLSNAPSHQYDTPCTKQSTKRMSRPRPVGCMGVEGLSLDAILANGPSYVSENSISTLDTSSVVVDGVAFDFPRPPSNNLPRVARSLSSSPTFSASDSGSNSSAGLPATPSTSDDEFTLPSVAPLTISKYKPPRDSVAKVFAPLDNIHISELGFNLSGMLQEVKNEVEEEESVWTDMDDDDSEAREYYRSNLTTHLQTISSTFASTPRLAHRGSNSSLYSAPARRDSMPLPPHISRRRSSGSSIGSNASNSSSRSRRSKSLNKRKSKCLPPTPISPGFFAPSVQLDPTFPRCVRRSYTIPTRPPPPPPSSLKCKDVGFQDVYTTLPTRPPPRSSLPVDVDFSNPFGDDEDQFAFFVDEPVSPLCETPSSLPTTPESAGHSFAHATTPTDVPLSPTAGSDDFSPHFRDTAEPDHALRSRWSTSTLGSMTEDSPRPKFPWFSSKSFKSESKNKSVKSKPSQRPSPSPLPMPFSSSLSLKRSSSSPARSPVKTSFFNPSSSPSKVDQEPTTPSNFRASAFLNSMRGGSTSPSPSPNFSQQTPPRGHRHMTQRSTESLSSFSFSSHGTGPGSILQSPTQNIRRSQSRSSTLSQQSGSSASSRDSMGLRRKPIPLEIFLRN